METSDEGYTRATPGQSALQGGEVRGILYAQEEA
jgi:hypothetical protein